MGAGVPGPLHRLHNLCRIDKTLRMSPAMKAGVTDRLWSLEDIADRIETGKPATAQHGPYKTRTDA